MNSNTKNILLGVLIIGLVGMTVAYAALSTTLRINGTASVPNVSWDIRLSNLTKAANTPSVVSGRTNTATGADTFTVTNNTAVTGLAVGFKQPGDKVVYNFTISNNGTIDAKLGSFSASLTKNASSPTNISTADIASRFSHSITCNPTQATENTDYLNKSGSEHSTANCTLTIQWNDETNQNQNNPGQDQTFTQGALILDYTAQWTYVQK